MKRERTRHRRNVVARQRPLRFAPVAGALLLVVILSGLGLANVTISSPASKQASTVGGVPLPSAPSPVVTEVSLNCPPHLATPEGCATANASSSTDYGPGNQRSPTTNGWVEDAKYENCQWWGCQSTNDFSGTLVVPSAPSQVIGQTIFLFIGMENEWENDIIQPVLQWGTSCAGGGNYWTIASWYVWGSGCSSASWSPLEYVSPGDSIYMTISATGVYQYKIEAQDTTSGAYSWLTTPALAGVMYYAFVTLEAYGVTGCSQYPSSGQATFSGLTMSPSKDAPWEGQYPNKDCSADYDDLLGSTVILFF